MKSFILRVPSGDMKHKSFWIRDAAMMAASGMIPTVIAERFLNETAIKQGCVRHILKGHD